MAKYGYIHIMPIGIEVGHVKTAINDRAFQPIQKIYLLHSPDNADQPLKKIAVKLKKELRALNHIVRLEPIDAFNLGSVRDKIRHIVNVEYENVNSIKNIVVNVTGGTNMMAVASMWAAGINRISAYYVLDNRHNPNLESYLVEIDTPMYKNMLETKPKHQEMLYILNKQTFSWDGIIQRNNRRINVSEDMRNSNWHDGQVRKGVTTLKHFKDEMLKLGKPKTTTKGRLEQMKEFGFVKIERNVPKCSTRGAGRYERDEYFIDQREELVSITDAGKSELIGYEPT